MTTALLDDLTQRISQQQSALQALRHELQTRRQQLADLTQRKKGLLAQLREIDEEIATLAGGSKPARAKTRRPQTGAHKANAAQTPRRQVVVSQRAPSAPLAQTNGKQSLPNLLLAILGELRGPMTVPELAKEAKRRGFQTKSTEFAKSVQSRCYELQKRGLVRHPTGQPGFVLASRQANQKGQAKPVSQGKPAPSGQQTRDKPSFGTKPGRGTSLRQVLTEILSKSDKPLTGSELAAKALQSGYRSTSKSFADVVWANMANLPNVERVPNQGYRLKKAKA